MFRGSACMPSLKKPLEKTSFSDIGPLLPNSLTEQGQPPISALATLIPIPSSRADLSILNVIRAINLSNCMLMNEPSMTWPSRRPPMGIPYGYSSG
ncbi:MAG: hypothetical protein IJM35_01675 [Bacteroidales bacterium]|nr:hypothetical protein [Bacteroidales bacterium]